MKNIFKSNAKAGRVVAYIFLIILGYIMIYPLLWMVSAAFKNNQEIFGSLSLLPKQPVWDGFPQGWKGSGQYSFGTFLFNTFALVLPTVFFTAASSILVAYGFSRFDFPFKKVLFSLMIATLMLPATVIIIPRYIFFKNLGWLDSYMPFIAPAFLGAFPFFNFMMVQFFRGIPKELDESARIDGCGSFRTLVQILLPLCKPAIFSVVVFQFVWTWNDFFNALIYISSVRKFPLALGLRLSLDISANVNWNQILAMSTVSIIPPVLLFFAAQQYFVEGITTSGLKD
ncbi:MAG: carbohydrate ABC transporter permease [Spirochaetaceae bacterium]|jgi:oligogalacturonide transport system permease protein|nr:carbohydrate ABC transporter permease [Spirochaetaceae bacterium]